MSDTPRIRYAPRPDAAPEAEISALVNVYKFALNCYAKKEGARPGAPDDRKGLKHDPATPSIPS